MKIRDCYRDKDTNRFAKNERVYNVGENETGYAGHRTPLNLMGYKS